MGGGCAHFLKSSAPELLQFESEGVLKIFLKKDQRVNESVNF